MSDGLFDRIGPERDALRATFDDLAPMLADIYAALTWVQKAVLLNALIDAGDHPYGYRIEHDGLPLGAERQL